MGVIDMSKFRDITIGNGNVGVSKYSTLHGFGIRVIMSVDTDQPKLSKLLLMTPGKEGEKPTEQNLKDSPFYIAWNEDRNDYVPHCNGIPQGRPSFFGAESSSIKRKIKNFDLFNFSDKTVKPTDILTAGQLYESVAPTLSKLITNYKYADSLIMDHDDAFGTYTQKSSNIGLIDQGPINGRNGDIIPAFISHYPYADNSGESAIIFAQEEVNYVPPGEGEEDGHFDYVPDKAVPRCLVGSTIFNEGLNVLTSMTELKNGWYKNEDIQSVFVVSGQGTTKYGGNDSKPFINMAADVNILPHITTPENGIKWDTSFNINTQCCVKLPHNKEFKIMPYTEYDYNQFLVGKAPNDGEEELLAVTYSEDNGFWDFICKVGAYLKKGLQVAIDIGTKACPIVKAIAQAIGNEDPRPTLLVNGDLKLEPAENAALPRVTLCAENIHQSVLTQPGVQWAIAPQILKGNRLSAEDNVIELVYNNTRNINIWEWYTKIMAWFEKGLKVVDKVQGAYHSILEVLTSQDTNALPAINITGNVRVARTAIVDGVEQPTFMAIDGYTCYTYKADKNEDNEIATHAYVLEHAGGGADVVHIAGAETITGQKTFNFCPLCYAAPDGDGELVNKKYIDDHVVSKDTTDDQIFSGAAKWIFGQLMKMIFKKESESGLTKYLAQLTWEGIKWFFEEGGRESELGSITMTGNDLTIASTTLNGATGGVLLIDGSTGLTSISAGNKASSSVLSITMKPATSEILFSKNPKVELVGSLSDNSLVTKSYVDSITLDSYLKLISDTDQTIKSGSIFFSDTAAKYISASSTQNIEIDYSHIAVNNTRTTSRRNGLHRDASTEHYRHDIYHEKDTSHLVIDSKYIVSDREEGYVQCIIDPAIESFAVHTPNEKFTLGQTGISFTSIPIVTDKTTGQETRLATEAYVKKLALFKLSTDAEQTVDSKPIHLGDTEIDFGNDVNNKLNISKDKIEIINRVETNKLEYGTITTLKGLGGATGFNIVNEPLDISNTSPAAYIELMGPTYTARIGVGDEWMRFQSPPGQPDAQGLFVTHSPEVVHSSNDTDLKENQLVTKGYIDRNTISPKYSKGTDSCGNAYEQAELSFNLFDINRPFSLILRRVKNGAMYKDVIMTTEVDGRTAPIAEGGWVRL